MLYRVFSISNEMRCGILKTSHLEDTAFNIPPSFVFSHWIMGLRILCQLFPAPGPLHMPSLLPFLSTWLCLTQSYSFSINIISLRDLSDNVHVPHFNLYHYFLLLVITAIEQSFVSLVNSHFVL